MSLIPGEPASRVAPGGRVLLRRGDSWSGDISLTLSTAAGTAAEPIVVGAYGSGADPILDRTGTGNIITVRGSYTEPASQYVRFENLRLTTTATPGNRPIGVLILESYRHVDPHHITFADCEIDHLKHGLTWYENGHVLERCFAHDNFGISPETGHTQGIYVSGADMTIRDNLFHSNRGDAPIGGDYAGYVNVLDPVEDVSVCNKPIANISDPNERNLYI